MYEFIKVNDRFAYIESPTKTGIIMPGGGETVIIDSGNSKDAGKRILKILSAEGLTLKAIFNTHYHADHIGGNAYLQAQTGCKIYAPKTEIGFITDPIVKPSLLYGGNPPEYLRSKFLLAQESEAELLTEAVLPEGVEIVPLPGHSFNMAGFKVDDAIFLADSLASEATIEKYKVPFLYDVAAYLQTLEKIKTMEAKYFVPSHAPATENIAPLAQRNIDSTYEIGETITKICSSPLTFDEILARVFEAYSLTMDYTQHALVGSTVKCYLTWLKETGRIDAFVNNNRLVWQKI